MTLRSVLFVAFLAAMIGCGSSDEISNLEDELFSAPTSTTSTRDLGRVAPSALPPSPADFDPQANVVIDFENLPHLGYWQKLMLGGMAFLHPTSETGLVAVRCTLCQPADTALVFKTGGMMVFPNNTKSVLLVVLGVSSPGTYMFDVTLSNGVVEKIEGQGIPRTRVPVLISRSTPIRMIEVTGPITAFSEVVYAMAAVNP